MTLESLQSLYIRELQDLYSAEKQLVRALPRMVKAANSPELKTALKNHLEQTREHARRLEQIFDGLAESPGGTRCKGMAALIREGQDRIKEGGEAAVVDAALIMAAQKIEHYEISTYGSVRTYANMLRQDAAAEVLQQTLNEEGATDEILSELAEATVSVGSEPERLEDIAMYGDTEPGGVNLEEYDDALQAQRLTGGPVHKGGTGAHWEEGQPERTDPVTGDRPPSDT